MSSTPFTKMHGLGNDFVVIDVRRAPFPLDERRARAIADRRTGIGCDQLILIEPTENPAADVFMRIHNADGGEVEACGNGTRCIAALVMAENHRDRLAIETNAGLLKAQAATGGRVTIDFGKAGLDWREIPLASAQDTLHVDLALGPLADPVCTNIGNPHATFFVDDVMSVDLETLGPPLEHHKVFPARANIGVAQIVSPTRMRFRVWERGVGITRACGTGACAALVASSRRGLTGRKAEVELDGGVLEIEWRVDGHVMMTGPVATSFTGSFDLASLG